MISESTMTSRERFITAVKNEKPDRVPACPCLSFMVPARRTGKPAWNVFFDNDPPLWKAYLDAVRYYGLDGRLIYGGFSFTSGKLKQCQFEEKRSLDDEGRHILNRRIITPAGELGSGEICDDINPPSQTEHIIKNLRDDLPALNYIYDEADSVDYTLADEMRNEVGEDAAFLAGIGYPGFHEFNNLFEGGLQAASFAFMDDPEPFEELRLLIHNSAVRKAEMMLEWGPDILYLGGSGTLTLSTLDWVRQFTLPTVQKLTAMAKEAGVPTMLHSCGRARALVDMFARETDLCCMNPLELPPMGDCELKEVKNAWGHRIALAGNIHTTDIMLRGSVDDVDRACREAIEDASEGGGFLLMTGDQCGRNTPDENIFAFVHAAHTYGMYD